MEGAWFDAKQKRRNRGLAPLDDEDDFNKPFDRKSKK